jgi:hypothetical protein
VSESASANVACAVRQDSESQRQKADGAPADLQDVEAEPVAGIPAAGNAGQQDAKGEAMNHCDRQARARSDLRCMPEAGNHCQ